MDFKWIRFLYAYPETITDDLISVVKKYDNICNYFDIPIQHYSDAVLKKMNRKSDGKSIDSLLEKIRKEIPDVVLRTSLIVGFPEETEEDFFELYEFVNRAKFEKLGVFKYSKEEGTPASRMKNQIHYKTKEKRLNLIMSLEQKISKIKLEEKIGNIYETLIESETTDGKFYIGRSYMDIPNEDGVIYIAKTKDGLVGKFVKTKITGVIDYDLEGLLV
jgi:ribosomal protein S12 methylthiotransferase